MVRKVFFSFHYDRDLWRANVVRNDSAIEGVSAAGFHDAEVWNSVQRKGDSAVKELIDTALSNAAVTVVLIGAETANRSYVSYELERSIEQGKGILGIRVNKIKDQEGRPDPVGPVPALLSKIGAPIYEWEYGKLGEWVEAAYRKATVES